LVTIEDRERTLKTQQQENNKKETLRNVQFVKILHKEGRQRALKHTKKIFKMMSSENCKLKHQ
jgi:hypothetical protein